MVVFHHYPRTKVDHAILRIRSNGAQNKTVHRSQDNAVAPRVFRLSQQHAPQYVFLEVPVCVPPPPHPLVWPSRQREVLQERVTPEGQAALPRAPSQLQDHVNGTSRRNVVVRQTVVIRQLLAAVDEPDLVHLKTVRQQEKIKTRR